jgi:regulator of protease activity HflC (stomatin/prohibitin superfamily)
MNTPMLLLTLLCGLTTLALICLRRIPEGQAYTLRRVDGHLRTVGAGVHLVLPVLERVTHKIRLLGNVVDIVPDASGGNLRGRVYFQVLDAQRADAVIDDIADLLRQRVPALSQATCTEDDVAVRSAHLKAELNRDLNVRGVLITRVQLSAG